MTPRTPAFTPRFRAEFAELIQWRRDVRRFTAAPVDPGILSECLELANLAPSVGLSQPWRFIQLDDQARRDRIVASFQRCNADALQTYDGETAGKYARLKLEGLREAPVHLAVFADTATAQGKQLGRHTMPEMLNYSVVTAVHTLWLAARAHGLGVGWVSILDPADVAKACDAHPDWSLIAYLCIGWPEADSREPELQRAEWETRSGLNGNFRCI